MYFLFSCISDQKRARDRDGQHQDVFFQQKNIKSKLVLDILLTVFSEFLCSCSFSC